MRGYGLESKRIQAKKSSSFVKSEWLKSNLYVRFSASERIFFIYCAVRPMLRLRSAQVTDDLWSVLEIVSCSKYYS